VVVGLGNPILSDDGVGLVVLRALRDRADLRGVTLVEAETGGLGLIDILSGHDGAVLVDAVVTGAVNPGEILEVAPSFVETTGRLGTAGLSHQVDLGTAWELGRRLGVPLPSHVRILGIEASDVKTFSERLTPAVARNLPAIVDAVIRVVAEVRARGARGSERTA
jgi:hydrogenase maturation protease